MAFVNFPHLAGCVQALLHCAASWAHRDVDADGVVSPEVLFLIAILDASIGSTWSLASRAPPRTELQTLTSHSDSTPWCHQLLLKLPGGARHQLLLKLPGGARHQLLLNLPGGAPIIAEI